MANIYLIVTIIFVAIFAVAGVGISLYNLVMSIENPPIPTGTIISFTGQVKNDMKDFLPCDGKALLISDYPNLSKVLNKKYNRSDLKDPTKYFNVPDLRNMFVRGVTTDEQLGLMSSWKTAIPNSVNVASSGEHTHELAKAGSHDHTTETQGEHVHVISSSAGKDDLNFSNLTSLSNGDITSTNQFTTTSGGSHTHKLSANGEHTHVVQNNGGHTHKLSGGDDETCPVHMKLNFMIKV